ncbi:MAG: bifunctional 3-phosphoshikimate 1-carboxyvinyltransferase/cytidylate kinase [Rhodocyclaceae bacterium]|nr:bifunctional 3-phosphoshikimate 1-carboxyvinyltransferase/cytidylate kinase [Rhodocyclaceae bacterium]
MSKLPFIDLPAILSGCGTVRLPGSKSLSNRILLLAALAEGTTEVRDLLKSDDTDRMLDALNLLGVTVTPAGEGVIKVAGCGGKLPVKSAELFLGNAGTAFRPLTAALALAGGSYHLSGVPRMHERPIGDLVDALRHLGADITYLGNDGYPPLQIHPGVRNAALTVPVKGNVSSQFLTGLLMALPLLDRTVTVEVVGELISKPYIGITLATMRRFGVAVQRDGWQKFTVDAGARYTSPGVVYVEGDASSASYFLALGAMAGGPVRVEGVGADSVQGDIRFADALAAMGARITMGPNWIEAAAPADGDLKGITQDCLAIPDAAMTLVPVAVFAQGPTKLTGIASWRVKETDRIDAMANELRKLGGTVETTADTLTVIPPANLNALHCAEIETYDDHRIAMCFSLMTLATPLRILDPGCTAKTFPDYFERFAEVTRPVPVIAIDGPSASGKGTVAQRVADALGWHYLDSGALYRLTALAARKAGVEWNDEPAVARIAAQLPVRFAGGQTFLGDDAVDDQVRSEEMGIGASTVGALPAVRAALLLRQRAFRQAPGLVADGRDMGAVVFPDATTKVFLTATAAIRAERRYKQLIDKGFSAKLQNILQDLEDRDARDAARSVAPLRQEADARLLETSTLTIEQAVAQVLDWSGNRAS